MIVPVGSLWLELRASPLQRILQCSCVMVLCPISKFSDVFLGTAPLNRSSSALLTGFIFNCGNTRAAMQSAGLCRSPCRMWRFHSRNL